MANAVTVIFGANSTQFQAELSRMQTMTAIAGRRMAAQSAGGHGVGMTGMIRESTVIGREIMMGRGIGRILGSMSLLIQYISSASRAAQQGASAARMLADGYAEAALKANMAAVAAMRKAEASAAAAEADGFEDAASIAAADANALEAESANATAVALARKAEAAEADAVAQEGLAASTSTAGISTLGIVAIFATVALAAGVVYERIWGVKALMDSLSFTGAVDFKDDYIPLMKRHINDVRNAQKEVTDEVGKTISAYNSAAEAAKRQASVTKEHYDHLKKMLEIKKETELAGAKTPEEKEAINAKFSGQELELSKQQQNSELADKLTEKANLEIESKNKLSQANSIKVNTKEEDQQMLGQLNQKAEAAEKFLKGGGVWEEFKKNAAKDLGGASQDLIDSTEAGGQDVANRIIQQRNAFANKVEANDETRKTKSGLVKDSAKSAAEAAKIGLELPNIAKENAVKNKDAKEEAAAKLAAEKAKDLAEKKGEKDARGYSLNSQQRIGAYAATAPVLLQQLKELQGIHAAVKPVHPPTNHPPGPRMPQLGTSPQAARNLMHAHK